MGTSQNPSSFQPDDSSPNSSFCVVFEESSSEKIENEEEAANSGDEDVDEECADSSDDDSDEECIDSSDDDSDECMRESSKVKWTFSKLILNISN